LHSKIIASLSVTSFYISMTGIFTEFIFGEEVWSGQHTEESALSLSATANGVTEMA
jgi:hypothetical protein